MSRTEEWRRLPGTLASIESLHPRLCQATHVHYSVHSRPRAAAKQFRPVKAIRLQPDRAAAGKDDSSDDRPALRPPGPISGSGPHEARRNRGRQSLLFRARSQISSVGTFQGQYLRIRRCAELGTKEEQEKCQALSSRLRLHARVGMPCRARGLRLLGQRCCPSAKLQHRRLRQAR